MDETTPALLEEGWGTQRLAAFSDGVYGIAATLLVLNLRLPEVAAGGLAQALATQWHDVVAYALSFLIIGIYWSGHHALFTYIHRVDILSIFLNILLLMVTALVPFPTAVLGRYLDVPQDGRTAVIVYSGILVLGALAFNLIWWYALAQGLVDPGLSRSLRRRITWQYASGPVAYLAALGLAWWNVAASFAVIVLVTLSFVFPALTQFLRRPIRRKLPAT
ncbi:MAG: DUF1211 domain-containing protein [Ktedonobacterales bacterium]|nr:DUF1211 domain-containing protein [Ktedonobacterales bacterium]